MFRLIFLLSFFSLAQFASAFDHNHSQWTETLKEYQNEKGNVKYKQLKFDSSKNKGLAFNKYIQELQEVGEKEYEGWNRNQKMAFLINSYNALTVKLIVDHYPVKSITKIGGVLTKPWSVKFFSLLGGKIKTLDPIEHEWLRPKFKDYRIHAAVNCASVSCPPLRNEAFVADRLDAQLNEQMTVWLASDSYNVINVEKKVLKISMIFKWYKSDFEEWGGGISKVIEKHSSFPRSAIDAAKFEYLSYNWDLNDAK